MPLNSLTKPHEQSDAAQPDQALSGAVVHFLQTVRQGGRSINPDEPMIHVSSAISEAATAYERLRYSIDYREEHLLRRHALERILRRRFDLGQKIDGTARSLLVELIHAKYLKNDAVPESDVVAVQALLDRYAAALRMVASSPLRNRDVLRDWLFGVASAELEEFLVPSPEANALVEFMSTSVERDRPLSGWNLDHEVEQTLTFIAAYRALYAFDIPTLNYLLLRRRLPEWSATSVEGVRELFPALLEQHRHITAALNHPLAEKLWRTLKSRAIVFHALRDIVKKHKGAASELLAKEEAVAHEVGAICKGYYGAAQKRLYRAALRSTLYILLTKVVIALFVEVPIEQFLYDEVHGLPLAINMGFPPLLMAALAIGTRLPGDANTKKVVEYLGTILYERDRRVFPEIRRSRSGSGGFSFIYALTFLLTFGLIVWGLLGIGFTAVSAGLFLFFLCVVSFFALRVRQPVRDLYVVRSRENIFTLIIDFFSLPILKVGSWISQTSARFNVFLFLFDYFLEAPFKAFLLLVEDVMGFFREKREDIL